MHVLVSEVCDDDRFADGPPLENGASVITELATRLRRTMSVVSVPGLAVDREQLRDVCRRYGVSRLDVFGSVSRGEATPESDVDVLYELEPGAHLGWDIEELSDELARLFGRPVDLVSRRTLHERLRDHVLAEALPLYAG